MQELKFSLIFTLWRKCATKTLAKKFNLEPAMHQLA